MLPACLYATVSSAAVALLSPLWLAMFWVQQPSWLLVLGKKEGDMPNGLLPLQQFC